MDANTYTQDTHTFLHTYIHARGWPDVVRAKQMTPVITHTAVCVAIRHPGKG